MYKPQPGGGMVFAEKIVGSDGQSTFARQPADDEPFTFWLRLNNPALLDYTAPFVQKKGAEAPQASGSAARPGAVAATTVPTPESVAPNKELPNFSGRGRLLYFDNLSAISIPQPNAPPGPPPVLRLTAGDFVGLPEFASRGPTPFNFTPVSGSTAVDFAPLTPTGSPVLTIDVPAASPRISAQVPDNAYRMKQVPSNQNELIFLTSEQVDASVFGVIRIFNSVQLPVLSQNRHYTVVFAEA